MKINTKFFFGTFFALSWIAGVLSQAGYERLSVSVAVTAGAALFAALLGYLNEL